MDVETLKRQWVERGFSAQVQEVLRGSPAWEDAQAGQAGQPGEEEDWAIASRLE